MENIRRAAEKDASRIAEIVITNYRYNFLPLFENADESYYFNELNVIDMANEEYAAGSQGLSNTCVYDDGIVKGIIRVNGELIEKLFVEPRFQNQHIGAKLLSYAVEELGARKLWVLEYNKRGAAFYKRNGFDLTGEKILEDGWVPLLKMKLTE